MLGQECEVIETVSASYPGYVKLYGDRWQAKTYSATPLKKGARAVITRLDGNKVFIEELNTTGEES
jgi:membrane protein implicated in regulation of membrane protease activity